MTLILNTWIFEQAVAQGTSQVDLVNRVARLGADGIEVRREYFTDLPTETRAIHRAAQNAGLVVNYSVPDELFTDTGQLNPKLPMYFAEGQAMGIRKIKFNTGHFDRFTGDLATALSRLPLDQIELNVENDQTAVSGTVPALKTFLEAVRQQTSANVGYVYDLGNWAFTHGDAQASAQALAPYTHYIHLKNTQAVAGKLVTTDDLDTGMYDWRHLLTYLPHDVDFALEYPMASDQQIAQQIQVFRQGVGD